MFFRRWVTTLLMYLKKVLEEGLFCDLCSHRHCIADVGARVSTSVYLGSDGAIIGKGSICRKEMDFGNVLVWVRVSSAPVSGDIESSNCCFFNLSGPRFEPLRCNIHDIFVSTDEISVDIYTDKALQFLVFV